MEKSKERTYKLTVRLPESVKARLDAKRTLEHRSLHAEILKAIDNHLTCEDCKSTRHA